MTLADTRVKRAKTLEVDPARVVAWALMLAEPVEVPLVTYDEIVAISKLMDIIYSIELDHRLHFAHQLWSH